MRYFSYTAMNGRLYLHYVAGALSYHTPEKVDAIFNPSRDQRIHTAGELDKVLRESATQPLPLGMLYLVEGPEEEARRRSRSWR